eukprot:g20406.t1
MLVSKLGILNRPGAFAPCISCNTLAQYPLCDFVGSDLSRGGPQTKKLHSRTPSESGERQEESHSYPPQSYSSLRQAAETERRRKDKERQQEPTQNRAATNSPAVSLSTAAPRKWGIFGLGNVGNEYVGTRHNIGRDFVLWFASQHGVSLSQEAAAARHVWAGLVRCQQEADWWSPHQVAPHQSPETSGHRQACSAFSDPYLVPLPNLVQPKPQPLTSCTSTTPPSPSSPSSHPPPDLSGVSATTSQLLPPPDIGGHQPATDSSLQPDRSGLAAATSHLTKTEEKKEATERPLLQVCLAVPDTYMNRSGRAVRGISELYTIPYKNTIIVYDDLDLQLGLIQIKLKGGTAGQRGITDVLKCLPDRARPVRVRVGIRGANRGLKSGSAYVLSRWGMDERPVVHDLYGRLAQCMFRILEVGPALAMNEFNAKPTTGPAAEYLRNNHNQC